MANSKAHGKALPSDPDATLRPTSRDHIRLPIAALPFLAPPAMPDDLGQLGPYRILRILGQGAMGLVLQGEDPTLGRPVAIKVMLPELAARADMRSRFLNEARAVAALQHDNIVSIYHVGEDQGVPYFTMPLLKGVSLEEYLRRGKDVSIGQAIRIAKDVSRGLAAAHEHGLIHRDIKPGNLWVDATAGGRIKILDFGVARPVQQGNHLTHAGVIIGTPAFMSPEQIKGKPEPRSDLYSLGAVLYRALAGRLPFDDRESLDLLVAVATREPPPLRSLTPHVPEELADLIMRLLAKAPEDRPESARAFLEELKAVAKSGSGPVEATLVPMMPEEVTPTEEIRRPGPSRRLAPVPPAHAEPSDTLESPQPSRPRKPKRRRKTGEGWKQAALLGGLALLLLAVCVALAHWLPITAPARKGDPAEPAPRDQHAKAPLDGKKRERNVKVLLGKNLDEWEERGKSQQWKVRDGVLACQGLDKGMMQSRKAFQNFDLELEWRLPEGGRAGVIVRHASMFPPRGAKDGIEIAIDSKPDGPADVNSCGAILGLLSPKEIPLSKPPAWNHYRIRCEGDRVLVVFNQTVVIDTNSQGRIAGLSSRGTISLHPLRAPIEFRTISIEELP